VGEIVVDRLGDRAPLGFRQARRERGHGRIGIHGRRLERPLDELLGRQSAGDEGKNAQNLFAAVAVDLATGQAVVVTFDRPGSSAGSTRGGFV